MSSPISHSPAPHPADDADTGSETVSRRYPIVRLRPKAEARALRHGFPWVYADELVTDRRTNNLAPGALAILVDADRRDLGLVTVNTNSKIIARMLDRNPEAELDQAWFEAKLSRAFSLRDRLYDQPFYRLVHAEADGLPGIVIDRFGDVAVIQPNAAWAEAHLDVLVAALQAVTGVQTVVKNATGRSRGLEGLNEENLVLVGGVSAPIQVPMNGAIYLADVTGGQKTGLFYDQRPNHAFAAGFAKGGRVLDMFAHVGGFGLAALAHGAASVLAVDASAPALALAGQGAEASGFADRFTTRQGDAFDVLESLGTERAQFDLVICDPPAFAPAKPALEAGLRAYERIARLAAPLVAPGGYLVLCSCSHAADLASFRNASARGIGRGGRRGQLLHTGFAGPDHPMLPQLAESGYLKALFFRLD
ncbi:RSP_2647 family RNA methyltransferase [Cypionkella sp.]|jgi:23S rRNA (cytosine1962-C5)-methyltransferase|uniref:RSP_2647 family RNA methyltransferase n=1 Tax=Cypionkella sp. TaxID=2811411 RepID=UPI0027209FF1|nr:class I SAM-dependent rRNA methyltransferase [Cypionkella sp.]MDO8983937.1 class I SAM-dependent rRNA methyltransferase [Cypionkella sp.]MDP2049460.1 class I SAM-dependent rRNA methyltransferase [Cypionkella sp.]